MNLHVDYVLEYVMKVMCIFSDPFMHDRITVVFVIYFTVMHDRITFGIEQCASPYLLSIRLVSLMGLVPKKTMSLVCIPCVRDVMLSSLPGL